MAALTAAQVYKANVKRYWPRYMVGFVTVLLTSLSEVAGPKFVQWAVDLLASGDMSKVPTWFHGASLASTLNAIMIGLMCVLFIGWLNRIGWRQSLAKISHLIGYDLRSRYWRQLRLQPLATFQKYSLGDLVTRASGDWNMARFIHGFTLVGALDMTFFTVIGVGLMLTIDPVLTALCLIPILFIPKKLIKLSKDEYDAYLLAQQTLSKLSDQAAGTLRTTKLQRSTATDSIWQGQLDTMAESYAKKSFEAVKVSLGIFPWVAIPTALSYSILLVLGVFKVQQGSLSIGELVAMLAYIHLMQTPLWELGFVIAEWQKGMASLGRMTQVFGMEPAPEFQRESHTAKPVDEDIAIVVDDLHFTYQGDERPILSSASLKVETGKVIGIKGEIGAGKSTLLNLIAGLQSGYTGRVEVLGSSIATLPRKYLASQVSMVPQKAFLFSGSIMQNLTLDGEFTESQLWRVLEIVQLKDEVQALSQGLHTWIGEWGINLSGGQRQRLALARALLRPQPILLLDDCLSAVDSITEEGILSALRQQFANQTVIWVAHRSSTLRYCDAMYELKDGSLHLIM